MLARREALLSFATALLLVGSVSRTLAQSEYREKKPKRDSGGGRGGGGGGGGRDRGNHRIPGCGDLPSCRDPGWPK